MESAARFNDDRWLQREFSYPPARFVLGNVLEIDVSEDGADYRAILEASRTAVCACRHSEIDVLAGVLIDEALNGRDVPMPDKPAIFFRKYRNCAKVDESIARMEQAG